MTIASITIARTDEDLVVTYLSVTGNVVEQTIFENNPLQLADSVRAILICDALRSVLRKRVKELKLMSEDELNTEIAWVVEDLFPDVEEEFVHELLEFAHDTYERLVSE